MIGVEPSLLTEPPMTPAFHIRLAEYSDVMLYAPKLSPGSKRKRQTRPAMKKISTAAAKQTKTLRDSKIDHWFGPGRSLELVLPSGRSRGSVVWNKSCVRPRRP